MLLWLGCSGSRVLVAAVIEFCKSRYFWLILGEFLFLVILIICLLWQLQFRQVQGRCCLGVSSFVYFLHVVFFQWSWPWVSGRMLVCIQSVLVNCFVALGLFSVLYCWDGVCSAGWSFIVFSGKTCLLCLVVVYLNYFSCFCLLWESNVEGFNVNQFFCSILCFRGCCYSIDWGSGVGVLFVNQCIWFII